MRNSILLIIITAFYLTTCNEPKKQNNSSSEQSNTSTASISSKDSAFYINEGTLLVKTMYAGIVQKLTKAIDEMGYYESVRFCNLNALPLTDSLAKHYGIKAKRTSLKLRNPANAPNSLEKQVLLMYEKTQSKKPVLVKTSEGIKFFTPIYVAQFCLTCHGTPYKDIPDITMKALDKWYPNDQAKNYQVYDIRGIWSITFPSNYKSNN